MAEPADGPNHHPSGTSVTHPACAGCAPEASGDWSSGTLAKKYAPSAARNDLYDTTLVQDTGMKS